MSKRAKRESGRQDPPDSTPPIPAAKKKMFRWVAVVAIPLLVLLVLELALRLAGFGYPTHFFISSPSRPSGTLEENPKFGWRFFPQSLARTPEPIRLSKDKPPGRCRIFVFGESAALGDPEPAYGFSRILRELLEARCPGTKFEVINTAMTAISSSVILRIARDCVPLQGDIWLVYMGNNEVIGPFGAGSTFGPKSPPPALISAGLAVKSTRIGQVIDGLLQNAAGRQGGKFQEWEGMKMMLNDQVAADDPILLRVYDHFSKNLDAILAGAHRAQAKAIVCSVSSNLKDCAPFASLHRPNLTPERQSAWTNMFNAGTALESQGKYDEAITNYQKAAEIDNGYALLAFHQARCFLALGKAAEAKAQYTRARDLDVLRFRSDTRINSLIREVCAAHAKDGVNFFDSEPVLTNRCKLGIPGAECFWDHVHLDFTGNYLLARGLVDQLVAMLPAGMRGAEAQGSGLPESDCEARLAYTDWDRLSVLDRMWRRVHEPPFVDQLDHQALLDTWSKQRTELQPKTGPEGLASAVQVYRTALARRDDDWVLHNRFAAVLEASGDLVGAEQQWRRVVELVPQCVDAWFKIGDVSLRRDKASEAADCYTRVLQLRPNSFEAMNGLGLVAMNQRQPDLAIHFFEQALQTNPKFSQAHINWGLLCSRQGKAADAEAHYREALRCDPDSSGAHVNLANLLSSQQKYPEAIENYSAALRIQPGQATVHLGLANALEALGRGPEAVEHYREAIRLNPQLAEAHFNLGVALAKRGDLASATTCFREAARLNADDPQAHLDLGVALAKQGQFAEAINEFKTVLRLDPSNTPAQQYLQTASARAGLKP